MAYVAPSTRTTGTLITASIWNQDVVANPIALSPHVLSADFTVTAAYSAMVSRYLEIGDGFTCEIGDDADLEIT